MSFLSGFGLKDNELYINTVGQTIGDACLDFTVKMKDRKR